MPWRSQAGLLGYTPSPQPAFQGDAAHQAQRRTWLTLKDSPGPWETRRDYRSNWTLHPFHRTVFTAHTWSALPDDPGVHDDFGVHVEEASISGRCDEGSREGTEMNGIKLVHIWLIGQGAEGRRDCLTQRFLLC